MLVLVMLIMVSLTLSGYSMVEPETRFLSVCKPVTGVYITLHTSYYAGTTADLWMGIRQGSISCTTSRPTWDAPDEDDDYEKTIWKYGTQGCSSTFDESKPIQVFLHSDSSNDVRVTRMGGKIGSKYKTWRTSGSYTAIDEDTNNKWFTAS